jgi:hypothetical protein
MNIDGSQAGHDARGRNYAGVALDRHHCLAEAYRIACLIEACGASEALTKASCAAFDFLVTLNKAIDRFEAERDAWKVIAQGRGKLLQAHGHAAEFPQSDCTCKWDAAMCVVHN